MPTAVETSDWLVFWLVAGARLLLPLAIPRYPLPATLASLLLDGVDQTVFQQFTNLDLAHYQSYDKSLDVYYLTIAYLSMLRNWAQPFALQLGRFLFYWRLVGVTLFELSGQRPLLLLFANTFEYFFIFYEAYRLRWDPARLGKGQLVAVAAVLWLAIKLPQEYWLHIAQLDTTDWLKTALFGADVTTSWGEILRTWPWAFVGGGVLLALVVVAGGWFLRRRLPPVDRRLAFAADAHQPAWSAEQAKAALASEARHVVDSALVEKIGLLSLVSLIFAQVLPGVRATALQLVGGVALMVTANTVLSHWLARREFGRAFALGQFGVLGLVNLGLLAAYALLHAGPGAWLSLANAAFLALLLALLVTLYDHYRQVYLMRFEPAGTSPG